MGLNSKFDDDPQGYDQLRQCWLNTRRTLFITDWLTRLRLSAGAQVLELGSGTGWLLRDLASEFPSLDFTGLEPIAAYVDYASKSAGGNLRFVRGAAEQAHAAVVGPFNAILSNDVLHHVESQEDVVTSAARIAGPGCRWLAIEPNWRNPYVLAGQSLKSGEKNFRPGEFLRYCDGHGWARTEQRYLFAIPPFVKDAPEWMKSLERRIEGFSPIAGGVCLDLISRGRSGSIQSPG